STYTYSTKVADLNYTYTYTYTYTGIRCQYTNTNLMSSWSGYKSTVQSMPPPQGVSAQTWTQVTNQLIAELQYVPIVQTLYNSLQLQYTKLNTQNSDDLNTLIGDALGSPQA